MAKRSVSDPQAYFLNALKEQHHLLKTGIAGMQAGDLTQALPIATSIRVLVHETRASVPLLKRLRPDHLTLEIFDREILTEKTIMAVPFNVKLTVSSTGHKVSLGDKEDFSEHKLTSIEKWWTRPCLKVFNSSPLCRRAIILGIANKEGAHVDDDMPENYRRALENQMLQFGRKGDPLTPINVTRFMCGKSAIELGESQVPIVL